MTCDAYLAGRWCAAIAAMLILLAASLAPAPSRSRVLLAPPRSASIEPHGAPGAAFLTAQRSAEGLLAKGKLLVASSDLRDPNFARTVVLLIDYSERGAMGVIINRATRVKLSAALPEMEGLKERDDLLYEGGPVAREEIVMLLRAPQEPADARLVFGDVYISNSSDLLESLDGKSVPFRVYSGYAGWAPGQLEAETRAGSWHVFPGAAEPIFTSQPGDLWNQFIRRTTLRLAKGAQADGHAPLNVAPLTSCLSNMAGGTAGTRRVPSASVVGGEVRPRSCGIAG